MTFRRCRVWPLAERTTVPLSHLIQVEEAVIGLTLCGQSARNAMQETPPLELMNLERCQVCESIRERRGGGVMTGRDLDYIETRLLAPAPDLLDAVERLRKVGEGESAQRLMTAVQQLTDACRAERRYLIERDEGLR